MPWCSQCKMEYVKGITVCADCGAPLVASIEEAKKPFKFLDTEKELFAKKFVEFLKYSKVPSVSYGYDENEKKWIVFIDESTIKQVKKLYDAFYSVEVTGITEDIKVSMNQSTETEANPSDFDEQNLEDFSDSEDKKDRTDNYSSLFDEEELEDIIESRKPKAFIPPAYVKKEDQYKDLNSSAFTFLIVSILGIAVLILNAVGVISIFAGIMPYIVMGGLFVAFLYIGVTTYAKSKRVQKEISTENDLTKTIIKWLDQRITKEDLNTIDVTESNAEISFFKKLDYMKELITDEFGDVDDGYLDQLVEEYYNSHFETQVEE